MRKFFSRFVVAVVALLSAPALLAAAPSSAALNTKSIEQLTGAKGVLSAKQDVFKVSVPRTDLHVTAAGVRITPPMGLTSWAAFTKEGGHTMVMGDLVLLEDQVNPVMDAALGAGLEVTALHNHFFWESPRVMFMHVGGMGDETKLAEAVGKVFTKIKETAAARPDPPTATIDPAKSTLDPTKIDAILGRPGQATGGVYKIVVGRETTMHGEPVGADMGVNTWAAFSGADDKAVVDGDFAMRESELQPVLKALRAADINIVAIHQHMAGESPRILFLHFWGVGSTEHLARGLKAALDAQQR